MLFGIVVFTTLNTDHRMLKKFVSGISCNHSNWENLIPSFETQSATIVVVAEQNPQARCRNTNEEEFLSHPNKTEQYER